ncbi:superinfection immunity protein [Candidatus Pacebacteria bacterium]|nr:superinfection immunity protein [Candidatus Paceibacterota bacterium]
MEMNKVAAIVIALISGLYLLPFSIALWRSHPSSVNILLLNFLLGWTVIGWIIAFFWAMK